ncbi:MAG: hypothetical protein IJV06_10700 [Bacteroidaceae bacterium]|nr:hypothetical protein [Bacteroidaceae bacterium]
MTKKEYIKPTLNVVKIQQTQMLTASGMKTLSGKKGESSEDDLWYELE